MCGIAGIVGTSFDRDLVPSMIQIMRHRGPDARGFFSSDGVHLGHARLSINDLSESANQPFTTPDQKIAIAVNGEIYNYSGIRDSLEEKGYVFQSNSDSEIVLHAYIDSGLDFVSYLNGMFAICIWDGYTKMLYLIRDRLGIKPLYYAKTSNLFLFASEIKAIAQCEFVDLSLDLQSFAEYLAFENYFSNRTLNEHINMVEPGEIVRFSLRDETISRQYFWQPNLDQTEQHFYGDMYERYCTILEQSVNRHLMSDVPVASYLSSGIDSSSVAYWASRRLGNLLRTYTGFFGMTGFYDESREAAAIADLFGCSHCRVEITPQDFQENIERLLWHLDEPKVGMGSFSQYMVARRASQDVKVILTGHGGDEFFAGYPVFKAIYGKHDILNLLWRSSPRELMFAVYFLLFPLIKREISYFLPNVFSIWSFRRILRSDFYHHLTMNTDSCREPEKLKRAVSDEYKRLILTYLKYYLPSLFVVEDKISMAFSLESRTPLCDNELLHYSLSIPLEQKLMRYELKHIPRTAMAGKLPDFIFKLPKRGFPTPLRFWFKKELKNFIRDFILGQTDFIEMFERRKVEKEVISYQESTISTPYDEIRAHKIWMMLNLILYFKNQKKRYGI